MSKDILSQILEQAELLERQREQQRVFICSPELYSRILESFDPYPYIMASTAVKDSTILEMTSPEMKELVIYMVSSRPRGYIFGKDAHSITPNNIQEDQ